MHNNNRQRGWTKRLTGVGLIVLTVLAPVQAFAVDLDTVFSGGAGYSDNIGRDPVTTLDEVFSRVGVRLDILEDSPRLELDVRSNLTYQWYREDTFDDELVGGLDGFGELTLVEDLLTWIVEEDYGQVLTDPLLPSRPDNREDTNYFSTGPQLYVPVAERTTLNLGLQYSTIRFETQPFDNDRKRATVALSREVREETFLSLNGLRERTEFDDALSANDYDRDEYFIRLESTGGRNLFSVDVGYTELQLQNGTSDGVLARFSWTRRLSTVSLLSLSGGTRYSDQGNIFRYMQDLSRVPGLTNDVTETPSPFRNEYASIVFAADGQRTLIDFRVGWNGEDYEERADLNREVLFADFLIERDLTLRIFTNVNLRYNRRDFSDLGRQDSDLFSSLLLGYRLSPSLDVTVQGGRFDRDSNLAASSFTENFVFLGFNYTPRWGR